MATIPNEVDSYVSVPPCSDGTIPAVEAPVDPSSGTGVQGEDIMS